MNYKLIIFIFCIFLPISCDWEDFFLQDEYKTFTIKNASQGINLFGTSLSFKEGNKKEITLLAREGHILQLDNNSHTLFQVSGMDGKNITLDLDKKQSFIYELNRKKSILYINNSPEAWQWLADVKEQELRDIRTVVFAHLTEQLKPTKLTFLKRLTNNSQLGLVFITFHHQNLVDILKILKPQWLYLAANENSPIEEIRLNTNLNLTIANHRQIKTLILTKSNNKVKEALNLLSFFPDLKSLCIDAKILESASMSSLPKNLRSLEELVITDDVNNISYLKDLINLKRLTIRGSVHTELDELNRLPQLRALNLYAKASKVLNLSKLTKLRAFSFPANITQEEFSSFCRVNEQLMHIELINCDNISDLTPLIFIQKLRGLVLVNVPAVDVNTIIKLKNLKYLVFSTNIDQDKVKRIKQALPGCQIIYGEPFSSDYGWLIFFISALVGTFVFLFFKRYNFFKTNKFKK